MIPKKAVVGLILVLPSVIRNVSTAVGYPVDVPDLPDALADSVVSILEFVGLGFLLKSEPIKKK